MCKIFPESCIPEVKLVIKGCNKRVIVMKDTGNAMIEEVFFILKPEASKSGFAENDIVRQANKILEKSIYDERVPHISMNTAKGNTKGKLSSFFSGAVIGAVITAGIVLML